MKRRPFLYAALVVLTTPVLAAAAQQEGKSVRIGWIAVTPQDPTRGPEQFRPIVDRHLRQLGWNPSFEFRYAAGDLDRLTAMAKELAGSRLHLIVAPDTNSAVAMKKAMTTIPIVMSSADPIGAGLWNPPGSSPDYSKETLLAARALGVTLQSVEVRTADDFEGAFASILRGRAEALVVGPGQFLFSHQRRIVEFSAKNRLPSIYAWKDPVSAGGLMAYGINVPQAYRRAAYYVDKIVRGTKPGDLPVEQPTKFDLVINLKTGKALGLNIPDSLLLRADEVIQ